MNKKQTILEVEKNRKLYTIPSGAPYQQRVKNAIHFSPSNSLKHELGKAIGAYCLRKWGDLKFSDSINQALKWIDEEVNEVMKDFPKEKADFITEAVPKSEPNRRVDLVRLQDDQRFEFVQSEDDNKIKSYYQQGTVPIFLKEIITCEKCTKRYLKRNKTNICQICKSEDKK